MLALSRKRQSVDVLTNDSHSVKKKTNKERLRCLAKLPRVNPGPCCIPIDLRHILRISGRTCYAKYPRNELWSLEREVRCTDRRTIHWLKTVLHLAGNLARWLMLDWSLTQLGTDTNRTQWNYCNKPRDRRTWLAKPPRPFYQDKDGAPRISMPLISGAHYGQRTRECWNVYRYNGKKKSILDRCLWFGLLYLGSTMSARHPRWFATVLTNSWRLSERVAAFSFDEEGEQEVRQQKPARLVEWLTRQWSATGSQVDSSTYCERGRRQMYLRERVTWNILIDWTPSVSVPLCVKAQCWRRCQTCCRRNSERVLALESAFLYTTRKLGEINSDYLLPFRWCPSQLLQAGKRGGGSYSSMAIFQHSIFEGKHEGDGLVSWLVGHGARYRHGAFHLSVITILRY